MNKVYPLLALGLSLAPATMPAQTEKPPVSGYHEFNYGNVQEGAENWVQAIRVSEPGLRSEVKGDVTVKFTAKDMTWATAWCWQQPEDPRQTPPEAWGRDVELTPGGMQLGADGVGSFVFPAEKFPNGPVNVRIQARNEAGKKDIFELQLFNTGGVVWNQGLPKVSPPGAEGMQLIFADDFDGPLSISNDGRGARYTAHKPGGGDFSGWAFSDVLGEGKPFSQKGTWLRIAARKDAESPQGRSGIISAVNQDFEGVWAMAPCYLECRFTAQSAIGTWPAFWTLAFQGKGVTDELDIIEAYGGMGKGNPNHPGYSLVSHRWGQKNADGTQMKADSARPDIMNMGGKSYWSTTFHTYAVHVGLEETVYYFDNMEVKRHATNSVSRDYPHLFLINYAIGGISGWPIDLARYEEGTDMWVDYVRVFAKEPVAADYTPNFDDAADLKTGGIGLNLAIAGNFNTQIRPKGVAGATGARHLNWNNLDGEAGTKTEFTDAEGKPITGLSATWSPDSKEAKIIEGSAWGFQESNKRLIFGLILDAGQLEITGVPYEKYDVLVYFGGGDKAGAGSVTLSSAGGGIDPVGTYFYRIGWTEGKFVQTTAKALESVQDSNYAKFSGNTAKSFKLNWTGKLEGAMTGVSGIQIIEVK